MSASGRDVDDDELDARLRALFADPRLDVASLPRTEEIVAGARRLRRRRAMLTGGGGALVAVAVAMVGLMVLGPRLTGGGDGEPVAVSPAEQEAESEAMLTAPPRSLHTNPQSLPELPDPKVTDPNSTMSSLETSPEASTPPESGSVTMTQAVLDATGYKRLELGMPFQEAVKTELLMVADGPPPPEKCVDYPLVEGDAVVKNVTVSAEHGVVAFTTVNAVTPDGVGVGSPVADVEERYPSGEGDERAFNVDVGTGRYEFTISNGTVSELRLVAHTYDC